MKEDKDNNSRYKEKINWSKKMKTLIRDAEISSNEERSWRHQLEIQGLVQLKTEYDDISSRYKYRLNWEEKTTVRNTKEISNEKEVEDINSRCKGKFNITRKKKTPIRDTKVFSNAERRRRQLFEIQRQV